MMRSLLQSPVAFLRSLLGRLNPLKHPRIFRYILLLFFLLTLLAFWQERRAVLERSAQVLASQLSSLLGEHVAFETLSFDVITLEFQAEGLRIRSFAETDQPPYVSIDRIRVRLAELPTRERIHIQEVRVERPQLRLELADGKLVHFSGLQALLEPPENPTPAPATPPEPGPVVHIDQLQVLEASLSARDPVKDWAVALEGLNLELRDLEKLPGAVSLSLERAQVQVGPLQESVTGLRLRGDLSTSPATLSDLFLRVPGGEVRAEGTFRLEPPPPDEPRALLHARVELELPVLNRYLPPEVPLFFGAASAEARLTLTDSFRVEGRLTTRDAQVDPFHNGLDQGFIIGDGTLEVEVTPEKVKVLDAQLSKGGGQLKLSGELGLGAGLPLKVQGELQNVALGGLLGELTLPGAWMTAQLDGRLEVDGTLTDPFLLNGQVELNGRDFRLNTTDYSQALPEERVFALPILNVSSDVRIDGNAAVLRGGLLESSRSRVFLDGSIGFNQRLDLSWEAVALDVGEFSPLSGFVLAGTGWGKGAVNGPFSDLGIGAEVSLFGARFDDYFLGDLTSTFLAPLNSSAYLGRLARARAGERMSPEALYTVPGLDILDERLKQCDERVFQGQLKSRSPAMLLLPDLRTRVGNTDIEGPVAIVFEAPYPLLADLKVGGGLESSARAGRLKDLLTIPGWSLQGDPLDGALRGEVQVMGPPAQLSGQGRLSVQELSAYGQPFQQATLDLMLREGVLALEPLALWLGQAPVTSEDAPSAKQEPPSDPASREAELLLSGTLAPSSAISAVLQLEGVPLERLLGVAGSGLQGRSNGLLTFGGSLDDPTVLGQLSLQKLRLADKSLGDSTFTLGTTGDQLNIRGLLLGGLGNIDATLRLTEQLPFTLRTSIEGFEAGPFLFEPETLTARPGEPITRLRLGANVRASGALGDETPLSMTLTTTEVSLEHKGLKLSMPGAQQYVLDKGVFFIPGSRLEGDESTISLQGQVALDGPVNLKTSGKINLALLDALVPETFQRIEGSLVLGDIQSRRSGEPFRIGGTLDGLSFDGPIFLKDGVIRTFAFPPTIDRLDATFRLSDDEVELEKLSGFLGGGPLEGQGTILLGSDYLPVHYDLELHGRDAFLRYPSFLPPGTSDLDLKFSGDVENLLLAGDIYLKRMVYRERYNWEKILTDFRTYQLEDVAYEEEEDPLFNLDIRIHVPGTFYIRNNIGNLQLKADLQLTGDTNNMGLYGNVESVRGTLEMLDNTFEVTQARLDFEGDYYNPRINMKMQTQIQSYTIFYSIIGDLDNWQLIPGSDAGLSERDINSLIAFRTLADSITEANDARSVAAPALEFLIGRFGLLDQLQSFTMLDRFTIAPATDASGDLAARVYGEKELVQNTLFASGYYDFSFTGNQDFLADFEWRALDCCSLIFRLDNNQSAGALSISPGIRLKLKLELE